MLFVFRKAKRVVTSQRERCKEKAVSSGPGYFFQAVVFSWDQIFSLGHSMPVSIRGCV